MRNGWPRCPIIYEIYPRSFLDTTGSGAGDLRGIYQKLEYVAALGVDAIWIAPFYPSPLDDHGYDITDHGDVDPSLGDVKTFDLIVERAHHLGLKVLIDQVLNHTSSEHAWFEKSSARLEDYDDWYVWADPKPDGGLPNNWMSFFGPPAWSWNHQRKQYYWHQFLACQPSLNLRNPSVQQAHADQMQYWRNRGVDGFRMDAISSYLHDESLRDNPAARQEVRDDVAGPRFSPYSYQDHVYDLLPGDGAAYCERVRDWAGEDAFLLGEINVGNHSMAVSKDFTGPNRLDAVYVLDFVNHGFSPSVIAETVAHAANSKHLAYWLSSHDQSRHASAMGDGSANDAKFLALACAVLPGPWILYQGEELGLGQPPLSREETQDPFDLMFWPDGPGRDGARVPIPWEKDRENYGFTSGSPWLPMRWDTGHSVAEQAQSHTSVLNFYRKLITLRQQNDWPSATFREICEDGDTLELHFDGGTTQGFTVFLNFGDSSTNGIPERPPVISSAPVDRGLPRRSGAIWAWS